MNPRRRLLRILFAGGLALALLGPSWHLAKRIRRALRPAPPPPPYGLQLVDSEGRKLGAARGPLQLVLDPFTVYRNAPNQTTDHFTVDALGRRGGAVSDRPAVVVLGGSLVFGQELSRDEEVVTRRMEELLPDRQAWNAGCVGYLSGQELAFYVHRLRDAPAEVVVVVDGWNELFDAWHFAKRRRGENGFNNQFFEIADRLAALHGDKRGRTSIAEDPEAFDRLIADYHANIKDLAEMAAARGAAFLWVLQPELGAKPTRTAGEEAALALWEKHYQYSSRGLSSRYEDLRKRSLTAATSMGIRVVDAAAAPEFQRGEELFADPVHLNAAGHRRLAELLARNLPPVRPGSGRSAN